MRVPHDDATKQPKTTCRCLGSRIAPLRGVATAVAALEANATTIGANGGEIYYGPSLALTFNASSADSRTPDVIVAPNVGVVYTGGGKKISEHGGFDHDDANVMMLVSNPAVASKTFAAPVLTQQVAPTILLLLGLDPKLLTAVKNEGVKALGGL